MQHLQVRIIEDTGLTVKEFNTHSFRIGAAATAKQASISNSHIKMLGQWCSDTYQCYVQMSTSDLAGLSRALASGTTQ